MSPFLRTGEFSSLHLPMTSNISTYSLHQLLVNNRRVNRLNGRSSIHAAKASQNTTSSDTIPSNTPQSTPKQSSSTPPPPKPNSKFSRQDLKRIKQSGPTMEDLRLHFEVKTKNHKGENLHNIYDFVPLDVLGETVIETSEPNWRAIPRKSFMEFYQGLRERNWTSKYYDPDAEPWKIQFISDSGRFMRPAVFTGYRAIVTKKDGSTFWVPLDNPGADTFLRDYSGGGSNGAVFKAKRTPQTIFTPGQYGYNQVFEQLFQAHEQRISPAAKKDMRNLGWTKASVGAGYDCPADHLLDVTFTRTVPEFTLHSFWEGLPSIVFYAFGISFLGIALAIGIFRPRKQMPTDMFQAMEFAQSKGDARRDGSTGIGFQDVGGLGATIHEMMEVVEFLKAPQQFASLEARPPKGILLSGEPGVGKTLVAKAIAGEAGVPFYQMAGSEFVEAIVGVGAARVRDLFKRARAQAPCIIFVDEIDALGIRRASVGVETNEEREQTLNQLLSEMDGFKPDQGVVFVAATNRPDLLDAALVRAGRFDRKIIMRRPDEVGREEILRIHARRHRMSPDVDLKQLAKDLPGLSGAELGNVLNEAALEAVRRDGNEVITMDIYNAVDRILEGIRRPALPDRFPLRRSIAVHEAGTAIISDMLYKAEGRIEPVERVSIVPRGRDWSRTIYARGDDEDYLIMTRGRLMDRIRVILAGRAAEDVAIGVACTYGVPDVRDATRIAIRMIANYGLDDLVGISSYAPPPDRLNSIQRGFEVTVSNIDADLFGTESSSGGSFQPSDDTWHQIRWTASELVKEAYAKNIEALEARKDALEAVTEALLEKETILEGELSALVTKYPALVLEKTKEGVKREKEGEKSVIVSGRGRGDGGRRRSASNGNK